MRIVDSEAELRRQLAAARLDAEHLEPWQAWKAFKRFIMTPANIEEEGASVQFTREETPEGFRAYLQFLRQFAAVEDGVDVPVRHVTIELTYRPTDLQFEDDVEVWSYEFPAFADFAAHVEGLALFQRAMNCQPLHSDVVCDEI